MALSPYSATWRPDIIRELASKQTLNATLTQLADTGTINLWGGQIIFPATQNPSTDPNTLDDYEEGNCTPLLRFGGNSVGMSYASQQGRYQKIGNTVRVLIDCQLTAKGTSTGAATLAGLPFAAQGNLNYYSGHVGFVGGITGATVVGCAVVGGAATANLYSLPSGVLNDTNFTNNSHLIVGLQYEAA